MIYFFLATTPIATATVIPITLQLQLRLINQVINKVQQRINYFHPYDGAVSYHISNCLVPHRLIANTSSFVPSHNSEATISVDLFYHIINFIRHLIVFISEL